MFSARPTGLARQRADSSREASSVWNETRKRVCVLGMERLASILVVTVSLWCVVACGAKRGTVGARFGRDADGHVYVREVPKGLGAANAGIQSGDEVILIDGRDVRALSDDELHRVLSGGLGEPVRFTILRGNEVVRMTIARTPVPNSKSKH